ncbi:MAG: hypothetical protein HN342_15500 [Nitrospina sp.]|jgi:hypothetical protein|nr:hypothetical protein [Nitrospina sp.]
MKRTLKTGFAILLVMSVVIGNIPFAAMMVCVHANDIHGEKAVHLHYGQLPGQPCHESADSAKVANATTAGPVGLSQSSSEEERRHFPLVPETLITSQASFKRALSLLSAAQRHSPESTINVSAGHRGGYRFYDPSFVFPDTVFINTTILII